MSIREVRNEAGFRYADNLEDSVINEKRRQAENEVNDTLSGAYTVPFTGKVPERVRTLTLQLAAGLLESAVYPVMGKTEDDNPKVKSARRQLSELASTASYLSDADNGPEQADSVVSGYPYGDGHRGAENRGWDDDDRFFRIGDLY